VCIVPPALSSYVISRLPTLLRAKPNAFFTDWDKGINGLKKYGTEVPKNSFAMKLTCLVEADGCTGFMADVVRELDLKKR